MKKRYGILSLTNHETSVIETYLSDQSARGRHLLSAKLFVAFQVGEPRRAHYRLEFRPKDQPKGPDEAQRDLYGSFGWEYVCPYGGSAVWRSYEENPPELHTDPQVEAALLEELTRKLRRSMPLCAVLILFACAMIGFSLFGHPQPVRYMVQFGTPLSLLFSLTLDLLLLAQCVSSYRSTRRLITRMKSGAPRPHQQKMSLYDHCSGVLYLAILALVLVCSLTTTLNRTKRWEQNLADYAGPLPGVTLAQVEDDPGLVPVPFKSYRDGIDYHNQLSFQSTALAPVQLEVREEGNIPGRVWAEDGREYNPSLKTEYYELSLPFLAEPLLDDLREDLLELYRFDAYTTQELLDTPYDEAWVYGLRYDTQVLAARLGNRVIVVEYRGEGDLLAQTDAVAAAMAGFTPSVLTR